MTESEIIDVLSNALPEGYQIEEHRYGSTGYLISLSANHVFWRGWPNASVFLFGKSDSEGYYSSFFAWIDSWAKAEPNPVYRIFYGTGCQEILAAYPRLLDLRDCSSVEELELRLSIIGF